MPEKVLKCISSFLVIGINIGYVFIFLCGFGLLRDVLSFDMLVSLKLVNS